MSQTVGPTARPEPWRLDVRLDAGTVLIELGGEFDLSRRPPVLRLVQRLLSKSPARLLIDLRGVTFIDSSGIRALLETSRLADASGTQFVIIPGTPAIQRVFEVCGLTHHLPFADESELQRGMTAGELR